MAKRLKYYIYGLVDSRTGEIFYIGKGQGNRMYQHVADWENNRITNAKKFEKIGEVERGFERVGYAIFHRTNNEDHAFMAEKKYIKLIGRENLTNISGGVEPQSEKDRVGYLNLLMRLKENNEFRSKHYFWLRSHIVKAVESFGYDTIEVNGKTHAINRETGRFYGLRYAHG